MHSSIYYASLVWPAYCVVQIWSGMRANWPEEGSLVSSGNLVWWGLREACREGRNSKAFQLSINTPKSILSQCCNYFGQCFAPNRLQHTRSKHRRQLPSISTVGRPIYLGLPFAICLWCSSSSFNDRRSLCRCTTSASSMLFREVPSS